MSRLTFWRHRQQRLDANFQRTLDELTRDHAAAFELAAFFEALPPVFPVAPGGLGYVQIQVHRPPDVTCNAKADALLGAFLTAQQGFDLANKAYFDVPVVGRAPLLHRIVMEYYPDLRWRLTTLNHARTYRIHKHLTYNVELLDDAGEPCLGFCACPYDSTDGQIPLGDILLGQKLVLETDEASFLEIANATPQVSTIRGRGLAQVPTPEQDS